ncbi:unnamed protein product [Zymoseptoria tritici ST99CH_3D1]|nr:unnamed protein product [Zymoseptoria tritici ST99CH_3D1]
MGVSSSIPPSPVRRDIVLNEEEEEAIGLFKFAEELRAEIGATGEVPGGNEALEEGEKTSADPKYLEPAEPWFLEMGRLRRMYFLYLNKQLASKRKTLLESGKATDKDMRAVGLLLHKQAEAIRDLEYIRSLDWLSPVKQSERERQSKRFFPYTGNSATEGVSPFRSENYRCLHSQPKKLVDGVREFLRKYLFVQLTYSNDEKKARNERYKKRESPRTLSEAGEKIARFIIASVGALFILIPMYIMALHTSRTVNLATTTIAVVLFAILCSITLRTTNDQTLSATAGYAAVLFVFVGLTSSKSGA